MTREEAINALKMMNLSGAHPFLSWEEMMEVRDMAISALRAQQELESNAPLTMDELRQMDGEPVWLVDLVHKSDKKVPDLWGGWIVFTKHDQNGFIPRGGGFFSNDGYGKTWLAYRNKQEEAHHDR